MARQPRGAYVRSTPDRYVGKAAMGGVLYFSAKDKSAAIGLVNNASAGEDLHIYGLWTFGDAEGPQLWTRQVGATGTLVGDCNSVITRTSKPVGQLYTEDRTGIASFPIPVSTTFQGYIAGGDEAGAPSAFEPNGPLCVLQPGDALYCQQVYVSAGNPTILAVTFYYVVLPDIGEV